MSKIITLLILLLTNITIAHGHGQIINLRWSENSAKLRIVADIDAEPELLVKMNNSGDNLLIELPHGTWKIKQLNIAKANNIKDIKYHYHRNKLIINIYFNHSFKLKHNFIINTDKANKYYRAVFDLVLDDIKPISKIATKSLPVASTAKSAINSKSVNSKPTNIPPIVENSEVRMITEKNIIKALKKLVTNPSNKPTLQESAQQKQELKAKEKALKIKAETEEAKIQRLKEIKAIAVKGARLKAAKAKEERIIEAMAKAELIKAAKEQEIMAKQEIKEAEDRQIEQQKLKKQAIREAKIQEELLKKSQIAVQIEQQAKILDGEKLEASGQIAPEIKPIAKNQSNYPESNLSRVPIIILDPGHGGEDTGAVSPYNKNIFEKNITLEYATALKKYLEREYKYQVFLTRNDDSYVGLSDRILESEKYNADIFISIHADSEIDQRLKGFSVYSLAENASDPEAAKLAKEQETFEKKYKITYNGSDENIKNWLNDMHLKANMSASRHFASLLVEEIRSKVSLLNNTHRYASFKVLRGNKNNPSVLIELGYLSNKREEQLLRSNDHRQKLVASIGKAIRKYFDRLQ